MAEWPACWPEVAFAAAALFDIMESQVRTLDPYLRQETVRACAELVRKFQPEHDAHEARRPDSPKTVTHTQAGH